MQPQGHVISGEILSRTQGLSQYPTLFPYPLIPSVTAQRKDSGMYLISGPLQIAKAKVARGAEPHSGLAQFPLLPLTLVEMGGVFRGPRALWAA